MNWISIVDGLPTENGSYLTYNPTSYWKIQTTTWLAEECAWEHEWLKKKRSEAKPKTWITHWMPLPNPPEEE